MPRRSKHLPGLEGINWIHQIFSARTANTGGIVRRKIDNVARFASHKLLESEVKRRKFHMVISGDQYIILCNSGKFDVVC